MIKILKDNALSQWWKTSSKLHNTGNKVSLIDKMKNEKIIENFRKQLFSTLKNVPNDNQDLWRDEVISIVKKMESSLSHYNISLLDFFIDGGYGDVTNDFIDKVNQFDPKMDVMDIFQAIRNVWIMNSIQILFDMDVKLTPSIFAYSMLYPYSDNYLDDSSISFNEKIEFSHRFKSWLVGEKDKPINNMEENIYRLVLMIEDEYDRNQYPQVFESLLAIHRAQEQSLIQQREKTLPYVKDIIGISFEKGGSSVLADAYLVRGNLDLEEANFMFSYGVFLQLIDDLQDVQEDFNNNHMTILSQLENHFKLDTLINKLMNYIDNFFENNTCFNIEKAITLKRVIHDCSYIMINEAVSKNKSRFSQEYIKELESKLIVRFSYLKKLKKKFQKTFTSEDIVKICKILSNYQLEEV